jgi:hypothetical protein
MLNFIKTVSGAYLTYKAITLLRTPWEKLEAYKMGLVDKDGKQLKKYSKMTNKEKEWFTLFHRFIYELKRIQNSNIYNKYLFWRKLNIFSLMREDQNPVINLKTLNESNDTVSTGVAVNSALLALSPIKVSRTDFMAIKNKKYNIASDKVKPYLTESECLFYCVELQQAVFYTNKD